MELSSRLKDDLLEINLSGNNISDEEYVDFKTIFKQYYKDNIAIHIYFTNIINIDTKILGYILKLKQNNKANISIMVNNTRAYNFLKKIEFDKFFSIKIKEYE